MQAMCHGTPPHTPALPYCPHPQPSLGPWYTTAPGPHLLPSKNSQQEANCELLLTPGLGASTCFCSCRELCGGSPFWRGPGDPAISLVAFLCLWAGGVGADLGNGLCSILNFPWECLWLCELWGSGLGAGKEIVGRLRPCPPGLFRLNQLFFLEIFFF